LEPSRDEKYDLAPAPVAASVIAEATSFKASLEAGSVSDLFLSRSSYLSTIFSRFDEGIVYSFSSGSLV
jgi:hypothetical protein